MARRFTLQIIMDLASQIGANPAKAVSRSNISFLGKGPMQNPLFQNRLAGLENATKANLGKPETLFGAIEDAVGWAKDGKLNSIQTEILGHNLSGINKILNPPPLPMASVTPIRSGIEGLKKEFVGLDELGFTKERARALGRFPKESHKFMGRPLKDKDFSEIDQMIMEGKLPDLKGRRWNLKSGLQEPGPGDIAALNRALNQKTGMSRAIARQILQQDTRIKLKPEELFMLKEGKGEPLDLMRKYYGNSMLNLDAWLDDFLPRTTLPPRDLASRVLNEVELIPQFAEGGLADVLQVRSGYSKGRLVKSALAILNRNKKNADYMYKASDNVSPGYAKGDLKYNAELLADQLAEDAGVAYAELGALEQTKFYGTAYDYLAAEMGKNLLRKRNLAKVTQALGTGEDLSGVGPAYGEKYANQLLMDWKPGKGRKPNASGGLARILEV